MADIDETRFRSFAERYICARAATFAAGDKGTEDGYAALLEAKSMYKKIAAMGRGVAKEMNDAVKTAEGSDQF